MANTVIQLKYSPNIGATPSTLANGELAINNYDGKLFYSNPSGVIQTIQKYSGPAGLNREIQFNDSGVLGSNSNFTIDKANGILSSTLFKSTQSVGDEGGQIDLAVPQTNTSISTSVSIDIYQNKLRFFESNGTSRGFYLDITTGGAGASTNLASGGATAGSNNLGYLNIPQNQPSSNYTLVLADAGKHIYMANGNAANTTTIPAATSVAFPIGTAVTFVNLSANAMTIAITTDIMYLSPGGTTGSRTLAQYGEATALKVSGLSSNGIWVISGTGLT